MTMVARVSKKQVSDSAIGWLKNTTIDPAKIADYLGFHGDYRGRFLAFAQRYRKELWDRLEAMTTEERIKWVRSKT